MWHGGSRHDFDSYMTSLSARHLKEIVNETKHNKASVINILEFISAWLQKHVEAMGWMCRIQALHSHCETSDPQGETFIGHNKKFKGFILEKHAVFCTSSPSRR